MNAQIGDDLSCISPCHGFTVGRDYEVFISSGELCVEDDNTNIRMIDYLYPVNFTVTSIPPKYGQGLSLAWQPNPFAAYFDKAKDGYDMTVKIDIIKCECGAEKTGSYRHYTWCQKYTND
jgi:hypothetical protein